MIVIVFYVQSCILIAIITAIFVGVRFIKENSYAAIMYHVSVIYNLSGLKMVGCISHTPCKITYHHGIVIVTSISKLFIIRLMLKKMMIWNNLQAQQLTVRLTTVSLFTISSKSPGQFGGAGVRLSLDSVAVRVLILSKYCEIIIIIINPRAHAHRGL